MLRLATIFFLTFPFLLSAGANEIDTLMQQLSKVTNGPEKSLIYSQLAKSFQRVNLDSAFYFVKKGIVEADKNQNALAENYSVMGDLLVAANQMDSSKGYYLKSSELFEKEGQMESLAKNQMILGNIFLSQYQYAEAILWYQKALEISQANGYQKISAHINNNLGVLYLRIGDNKEALPYFQRAKHKFSELDDNTNMATTMGNIGEIYAKLGNDSLAISAYLEVIPIFTGTANFERLGYTYNAIARSLLNQNNTVDAIGYIEQANNIYQSSSESFNAPSSFYQVETSFNFANYYYKIKNNDKALKNAKDCFNTSIKNEFRKEIEQVALFISQIYDMLGQLDSAYKYLTIHQAYVEILYQEEAVKKVSQLKLENQLDSILAEKELSEIQRNSEIAQKESFYRIVVIIGLSLAIISLLLFFIQRSRAIRSNLLREKLELEKSQLGNELSYKNKELTTNMMYLLEKNEFITLIARKLTEIKKEVHRDNKLLVQKIINELKLNSEQSSWDEFEIRFMEVHSEFYKSLNEKYTDLSPNEKKICAFLRLNMTTKEISAITHQSVKSINVARSRLRKKMNIDRDENLITYLDQL